MTSILELKRYTNMMSILEVGHVEKDGQSDATARNKLKNAQHRPSIIMGCWKQVELW
jgi:hypothetical protein